MHYAGWMRAQKVLPASALAVGVNALDLFVSPANGGCCNSHVSSYS